jgi:hypothetical protein
MIYRVVIPKPARKQPRCLRFKSIPAIPMPGRLNAEVGSGVEAIGEVEESGNPKSVLISATAQPIQF